jgi:hypothetical protein
MKSTNKIQLERLKELEQSLWEQIQANKEAGRNNNRLNKLYSDVAFKILRHEAIYDKADDDDDDCILDEYAEQ